MYIEDDLEIVDVVDGLGVSLNGSMKIQNPCFYF